MKFPVDVTYCFHLIGINSYTTIVSYFKIITGTLPGQGNF